MKPLIRPLGARGVRLFKVYVMKVVLLSTLLLASLSARAELIEAQGSAAILGGDEVYAREQATRDALRQALFEGIGHAKAFGCGLLLLRPIR